MFKLVIENFLALTAQERFEVVVSFASISMFAAGVVALFFNIPLATACLIGAYVGDQLVRS